VHGQDNEKISLIVFIRSKLPALFISIMRVKTNSRSETRWNIVEFWRDFFCRCLPLKFKSILWVLLFAVILFTILSYRLTQFDYIRPPLDYMQKDQDDTRRVVVSMKTMPSRIQYIKPTLDSLLQKQSLLPDTFYLALPQRDWKVENHPLLEKYIIPDFLHSYIEKGNITILQPEFDYGPIDKMIHALSAERDANNIDYLMIYLDDDVIYHPTFIQNLVKKGNEYPDAVVAFSGTTLRSNFRQIAYKDPELMDRHPYLFYFISEIPPFRSDMRVDIVQGFTGVLIRPRYFDFAEFLAFVQEFTKSNDVIAGGKLGIGNRGLVWKADDFIISAYLEYRNVTRFLVSGGGFPDINKRASKTNALNKMMHLQAMEASTYLQKKLNIWKNYTFFDIWSSPPELLDLINCESGNKVYCKNPLLTSLS